MRHDHEKTMEELSQAVGQRVRQLLLSRPAPETTLVALSRRAGMSVSFLSMIENGRRLPSLPALVALSEALDTAPALLLQVATAPARVRRSGRRVVRRRAAPKPSPAELLEPVADFFRSRGLGEPELRALLEAAHRLFF